MSGPSKKRRAPGLEENNPDPGICSTMSAREAHLTKELADMQEFYEKKLSVTKSELENAKEGRKKAEDELRSFKDRMALGLSPALNAAKDTENMTSPVNMTRLREMYQHLRVNEWPKVRGKLRAEKQSPETARKIIQDVFKEAVSQMESVKKALSAIFTGTMSQKDPPKKVQDHLRCRLENLQLALFHSNKQDLHSAAVLDAPEVCRELLSECFRLFSLMALSKTPLQPQWDSLSEANPWDCFPAELTTHFSREDPNKLNTMFTQLEKDFVALVKEQLKRFHGLLTSDRSSENSREENPEREGESSREAVLNITLDFLRRRDQDLAERLSRLHAIGSDIEEDVKASVFRKKLKTHLKQKFSQVCEGVATAGNPALLKEIYPELDITEIDQEHGVRKPADTALAFENIFKKPYKSEKPIRTVLTEGVAGVGKTALTQKISLDWAEGRVYQDVQLLFPFTFRELNELKDKSCSLEGLLHHFFSGTEELCSFKDLQLLFIFDGLDECRLPLDFKLTRVQTEPTKSARVEELLVNLVKGNLLPSARLWITTRPEAAIQIPAKCVSMVTEVRGFSDPQREQFFRKRFRDKEATPVISHIKNNPSLCIKSRSPYFCWIIYSFVNKTHEWPTTLTRIYTHLLQENFIRNSTSEKDTNWSSETKKLLQTVRKQAFEEVKKGNMAFYVSDLSRFDLDNSQVACFTRPNMKEFLAALHVHHIFFSSKENLLSPHYTSEAGFYQSAVDWSLQSPNGHLDMFLGFLLGLSLSTNQKLLKGLVSDTGSDRIIQETVKHIHMKLNVGLSAESSLNLLHCLNELNDRGLLEETQKIMTEGGPANKQMSAAQWSALCFHLLSSQLEEFDLKKFCPSEEGLQNLLPVVKATRKANLSDCNLSEKSCGSLASVLSSSSLTHLDLSINNLQDSGVMALCEGLKSAPCRLETLSLSKCQVTEKGGEFLADTLSFAFFNLRKLDLSFNRLGASAKRLTALQDQSHGRLVIHIEEPMETTS